MPLLDVNEVVKYVIGDERVWDHIRRQENRRSKIGFRDFASQFGIHDLGELSESQLMSLVAARNTAPIIDLLRIPSGKAQMGQHGVANYDLHRRKTALAPALTDLLASTPGDDQEWEMLRDPEDIPYAVPEDLLLRRLAPKEFLRRLTEGELIRSAWIQDDVDEQLWRESQTPETASRPESGATSQDARPHGYLLLDASESMGSGRDHRDEVARGLALAYLRSQFESGNPTVVYLFRHELSPVYGGENRSAFEAAVGAILAHSHEGMTNLQGALKLLADAMRVHQGRVDIALITDGITRLTQNPVEGCHLHTFLVGVRPEEFDKVDSEQYQGSLDQLRTWSDHMYHIDPDIMKNASVPRKEDVIDFGRILIGLDEQSFTCATDRKFERVQQRLVNLRAVIDRYRRHHGHDEVQIEELHQRVEVLINRLGSPDTKSAVSKSIEGWTRLDRELMEAIELREMRSIASADVLGPTWGKITDPPKAITLWEALLPLLRYVKRKARGAFRRVKRLIKRPQASSQP